MPVGKLKNSLYGVGLELIGKRPDWKPAQNAVEHALFTHHAMGASLQVFRKGEMAQQYHVGFAGEGRPVSGTTVFRTASLAKTVVALLVFRLQTKGEVNVGEDISSLWGEKIRSPYFPKAPVTLGMLLSHTSGIIDGETYFSSFEKPSEVSVLLENESNWSASLPGTNFRYSNFAAGVIGSLLEKKYGESLETLIQRELFLPMDVKATFDLSSLNGEDVADSWRVLPYRKGFDAKKRIASFRSVQELDPEHHYLMGAGGLFLTSRDLAKLTMLAWNGGNGFLNEESLSELHTPITDWPEKEIRIRHNMGLFTVQDESVYRGNLWGHQGIAYGAVNGLFFDEVGNGFTVLTSGASEQRKAHLTRINLALIQAILNGGKA